MLTAWTFDNIENKHNLYRGEDCTTKFCVSLRQDGANVINFEMKKKLQLTKKELKICQYSTVCYVCRKTLTQKLAKDKNFC